MFFGKTCNAILRMLYNSQNFKQDVEMDITGHSESNGGLRIFIAKKLFLRYYLVNFQHVNQKPRF